MKPIFHRMLAAALDPDLSDAQFRRCVYLATSMEREKTNRKSIGELFDEAVRNERYKTMRDSGIDREEAKRRVSKPIPEYYR